MLKCFTYTIITVLNAAGYVCSFAYCTSRKNPSASLNKYVNILTSYL